MTVALRLKKPPRNLPQDFKNAWENQGGYRCLERDMCPHERPDNNANLCRFVTQYQQQPHSASMRISLNFNPSISQSIHQSEKSWKGPWRSPSPTPCSILSQLLFCLGINSESKFSLKTNWVNIYKLFACKPILVSCGENNIWNVLFRVLGKVPRCHSRGWAWVWLTRSNVSFFS